jgi:hypothetical protein
MGLADVAIGRSLSFVVGLWLEDATTPRESPRWRDHFTRIQIREFSSVDSVTGISSDIPALLVNMEASLCGSE